MQVHVTARDSLAFLKSCQGLNCESLSNSEKHPLTVFTLG